MPAAVLLASGSLTWYVSRATGVVSLAFLTASVLLGILTSFRWSSPNWPRFVVEFVHRNVSLLVVVFVGAGLDAAWLALISDDPTWVPVTIACLTLAGFLGLGNGAVFKAVPRDFPDATGAATGIVGAAGGIGGFFPPVVMGIVKDHFDTYALGFVGLLAFTVICLIVALSMRRAAQLPQGAPA